MSLRVAISHRTSYHFDRWVRATPHVIRLRPAPSTRTPVLGYTQLVEPAQHFLNWQQDPFGNWAARVVFPEPIHHLLVDVEVIADLTPFNPFDFFLEPTAETSPFVYDEALCRDLAPYLELGKTGPRFDEFVASLDVSERETNDVIVAHNRAVTDAVTYEIRMEPGVQSVERTLERGAGSCRDSAWLLVQVLRHLGFAARFVSGYLVQLTADEAPIEGPAGPTADFTDLHAWAEVYLPGAGWVGLDATSGLLAGEGHIPLAATPSPSAAAPITGAIEPCEVEFDFSNTVRRVHESPRTTSPYSSQQRERILALGEAVDARLTAGDVRLTVGGEPTFVSIDDRDGPEWTFDADGPQKRRLARQLTLRLREHLAAGSMLHEGQGKWYPGEPLPRWSKRVLWRRDGVPLWPRDDLIAGVSPDAGTARRRDARHVAKRICAGLGLPTSLLLRAYEDPLYHLWQESTIPADVDPADLDPERADLDDVGHRAQLASVLSAGVGKPAGFVLPLAWTHSGWVSGRWRFRRDRLFLAPGSSAVGLRLPLDRLPVQDPVVEAALAPDPFTERVPLPPRTTPTPAAAVPELVGTALCVELRDGVVHVFMPPIEALEGYVELVSVVHDAAAQLEVPVRIEGYEPPSDPRLESFAVTPDPGVIEVNVAPVRSWAEAVETTTDLYRIARECRLSAEKFDLDGRHTGTGGGNHLTLGGPTPADSPVLRRPDLLRSMLTYWQHHPGLSYLFSGQFIGPTSQSPRVDEARNDALDELEIAFEQLDEHIERATIDPDTGLAAPWTVDRLLRNLLTDLTGNTHRAEFCIDKLYPPDAGGRRLGLVELRGFEMPPHPDMSLVQQLLVRALVARFWEAPYRGPLVRWGTRLHDQYLLPHFVAADVAEVCADLRDHGIDVEPEWFDPFVEFRFPLIGEVTVDDVHLELRRALEPWNVLGEQMTATGSSRAVDASLERVQVRVSGAVAGRHVLTCNGVPVPLHPVGDGAVLVGGVRYKAWSPPFALHPTIAVSGPLLFDLVDLWSRRSLGGCRYHVSHPGGRSYETFPVNANEAAGRRQNRFWEFGHTPVPDPAGPPPGSIDPTDNEARFSELRAGRRALATPVRPPEGTGFTLDLRRAT